MSTIELIEQAIQLEREAQETYKNGAAEAGDAETRALFEQLARWEAGHEQLLRERLATVKMMKTEKT